MTQQYENAPVNGATNEIYIQGIRLHLNDNGEATRAIGTSTVNDYREPVVRETISATKAVDLEGESSNNMILTAQKMEETRYTLEKARRSKLSAARTIGKVVLYTTLFGIAPGLTGTAVYNAGHHENISNLGDVIPAITQTWHEANSVLHPFGGGQ